VAIIADRLNALAPVYVRCSDEAQRGTRLCSALGSPHFTLPLWHLTRSHRPNMCTESSNHQYRIRRDMSGLAFCLKWSWRRILADALGRALDQRTKAHDDSAYTFIFELVLDS